MTDAAANAPESVANKADIALKDAAVNLASAADQVRKTVTGSASVAKEWTADRAGVARDWAMDQSDVLRDTVQTKPFISIGVSSASAFAAGVVLGVLLTRR